MTVTKKEHFFYGKLNSQAWHDIEEKKKLSKM